MNKEKKENVAIVGQWVAGVLCGAGIGIEIGFGAEAGYMLITAGSLVFATFTKIRKI